jgi:subtilisin family serine protease/uncharacterized protein (DUF2141 family)
MSRKGNNKSTQLHLEQLEARAVPSTSSSGTTQNLIVRFVGGAANPATRQALTSLGLTITTTWFDGQMALLQLPAGANVNATLRSLQAVPQVGNAEPDGLLAGTAGAPASAGPVSILPNDPAFASQWGLQNPGGVDIRATQAWATTTGSSKDLVAVLDTGVAYDHPDLYLNIAINQGEIPPALLSQLVDTDHNGIIDFYDLNSLDTNGNVVLDSQGHKYNQQLVTDFNGNGYIDAGDLLADPRWKTSTDKDGDGLADDLVGWNYLNNTNDPVDNNGHGTHVTGILAAIGNNGSGVAGVNWHARILPLEVNGGSGVLASLGISAIQEAVLQGARVINASWGDYTGDPALRDAVELAGEKGTVFVAAAGNQSNNNDLGFPNSYFPASYDLPNLLSVGSVDPNGFLSNFSNFGHSTVALAAPGSNIVSIYLGGTYASMSGTSMATPYVAGVVSLLDDLYPQASATQLVDQVLATVRPLPDLTAKTMSGGMLDANAAVNTPLAAGPRVLALQPGAGADPSGGISTPVSSVTVSFDRPIEPGSFTTGDVTLTGPAGAITPTAVTAITDMQYAVSFPSQSNLGTYTVSVGPGVRDRLGRAMDQNQNGIPGEPTDIFVGTFNEVPPPDEHFLDDAGTGFSASGSWSSFGGTGFQGGVHFRNAGNGSDPASWTFTGLTPGMYRVSVTWVGFANRAPNATYFVSNGVTQLGTAQVDQRQSPASFFEAGVWWQDVGGPYLVVTGNLVVQLSDLAASGTVLIADAVRIERVGDTGPTAPQASVLDGTTAVSNGSGAVNLGRTDLGTPVLHTFNVRNLGTAALTLGALSLPAGFSLAADFGATTVAPGSTTSFTVSLTAAAVGVYSGQVSFATNDPNANPFTFTVSGLVSTISIQDDGGAGFSASSNWAVATGIGDQGTVHFKAAGAGNDNATWTFVGLTPGTYRVSATWVPFSNRAPAATYTVATGATQQGLATVDQRQTPANFTDQGLAWQDLGGPYQVTGNALTVQLSDLAAAGSYLIADAVRIELVGNLDSNQGPHALVLDGLASVANGSGAVDLGHTNPGTPVTHTFTVRNVGTADLALSALTVPAGFSVASGFGVGTLAPGASTAFTIQLDAAAAGNYGGQVSFATNDPNARLYTFALTGAATAIQYVDDGDPGFSASANWVNFTGAGRLGDLHYKLAGSGGDNATWTFTGLAPGSYRVSVTWVPDPNRAPDASFAVGNGTVAVGAAQLDQRQAPAGFFEDGTWWQDVGGPYGVNTGTLTVQLSDLASPGTYLIADAVRVERVSDSFTTAPQATVLDGTSPLPAGTGVVDFGRTDLRSPLLHTFTVRNTGTANLTLGSLSLPAGFSLAGGFGATTLVSGASTTFTVRLDAAALGAFGGVVSFATNDANANPFTFTISGLVSVIRVIDDDGAGFLASSNWTMATGVGSQGDIHFKVAGSGNDNASWTFAGLTPGSYRVSVTWVPFTNRAPIATYLVGDGTNQLGTSSVDQEQAPAGFTERGIAWQDIGGPYQVSGNTLVVQLSDLAAAGTYLIADAVRVELVGGLTGSVGPHALLLDGLNTVADDTGLVDLRRTDPGTPILHTFTVRNVGTDDLALSTLSVPAGYSITVGFGTTTLAPGAATTFSIRLDAAVAGSYSGLVTFLTNDTTAKLYTFAITGNVSAIQYLDDSDPGFSASANWLNYNGDGRLANLHYKLAGSGSDDATWTFVGLAPGSYRVSVTWVAYFNRSPDATYMVSDGTAPLGSVMIDQRQAPVGFSDSGSLWQDLRGPYDVSSGTLVVQLSDLANPGTYLIADAVRLERVGDLSVNVGPRAAVQDGTMPVAPATGLVYFGHTSGSVPVVRTFTVHNSGTADLTLGAISVPAGFSLVSGFGATTLAPGASTTFCVQLDAAGLGSFSGLVSFATNDVTASSFTFTVFGSVSQVEYLDNDGAGFSAGGAWLTYIGAGSAGDLRYRAAGLGNDPATWTFTDLTPGRYRVSVTWDPYTNRAPNAAYSVSDGTIQLNVVQLDQRQAPASFTDAGQWWQDVGGPYDVSSGTLLVQLSDLAPAGTYLIADAVRIEYIGALVAAPTSRAMLVDGTTVVPSGTGLVDFGHTVPGSATVHTFTVRNSGSADLSLGPIGLPPGFSLASDLGMTTVAPGASTTFSVQLDAINLGSFSGFVTLPTNDPNANPFTFVVSGAVSEIYTLDDSSPGFSASGNWANYNGSGVQGNLHYKLAGTGNDNASWTFTGLTPGRYRVSATWVPYGNRVPDAIYYVSDGTSQLGSAQVDQRTMPATFAEGGVPWQDLGTVYSLTGSTLVVTLSDNASLGYLIADSIRLERLGSLDGSVGPQIAVMDGAAAVAGGSGQINFGRTNLGQPVVQTFTIHNAGSLNLTLGTITLPNGFSLVAGPTVTTLAPGAATTFSVQLDAAAVGTYGGLVSIVTNDPNANPFVFTVTGAVSQILYMDNSDPGFSASGNWSNWLGDGFRGDMFYKAAGSGNDAVSWTFTGLAAGTYRVSVTWVAYSNRASNATYFVFDGITQLRTAQFDQRLDPASFAEAGVLWQDLGTSFAVTSGTLVVQLSDLADSGTYLIADALRIERIA